MREGTLDGYNVLVFKQSKHIHHSTNQPTRAIYSVFKNDKLFGKTIMINGSNVQVCQYINGELEEVIASHPIRDKEVYTALTSYLPGYTYTLE